MTALIAYSVVSTEMLLFDLKDGYCRRSFTMAKRFCCRPHSTSSSLSPTPTSFKLASQLAHDTCAEWRTWADVYGDWAGAEQGGKERAWFGFGAFLLIAVGPLPCPSTSPALPSSR